LTVGSLSQSSAESPVPTRTLRFVTRHCRPRSGPATTSRSMAANVSFEPGDSRLVLHSSGPVMRSLFPITLALARVFSAGSSPSGAGVAACSLELGRAGGARERNDVADVLHAGHVHEQALEAEAEAGVGDGAEASEIEVPGVGGFGEAVRSDLFPE